MRPGTSFIRPKVYCPGPTLLSVIVDIAAKSFENICHFRILQTAFFSNRR